MSFGDGPDRSALRSENELATELNLAGIMRRERRSERRVADLGVKTVTHEAVVIERVEEFAAELERATLAHSDILDCGEVPQIEPGTEEYAVGAVPEVTDGIRKG